MKQITSKRHLIHFYAAILFAVLLSGGCGILFLLGYIDDYQNQIAKTKDQLLAIISCFLLFLAIYTIPRIYKNAPVITLDAEKISFKSFGKVDTYYLKEISSLELTGKQPFPYLYNFPLEGAQLLFHDGKVKFIFDSMYANSSLIKLHLQEVVLGKKIQVNALLSTDSIILADELFTYFKGNQFTSFRGIFLWGLTGALVSIPLTQPTASPTGYLILAAITLFLFLLLSWFMHYFGVSENYLVIKNHTLPWINRLYSLADVREVVFEQEGKRPNCLRVITQDFKSKLYPAGTLKDKHWLNLKDVLEQRGIVVRNECIPDPKDPVY